MFFDRVDDKYISEDGEVYDNWDCSLSKTWSYKPALNDRAEYIQFYTHGYNIEKCADTELYENYKSKWKKFEYHLKSLRTISYDGDVSIFKLVPVDIIRDFAVSKIRCIKNIHQKFQKPDNYDFYLDLNKFLLDISKKELNVEHDNKRIFYDPFGTKTGRLTTKQNSFPILTIEKEDRNILEPKNDFFIELDYDSAEIRTFIGLCESKQPEKDLHSFHADRLNVRREVAKKKIFQWLYGSKDISLFSSLYSKNNLINKYFHDGEIKNYYNRRIFGVDRKKAMSYIIQSTFSDLFLRNAIRVKNALGELDTFVSFMIHDSVVLDMKETDTNVLSEVKRNMENTDLGHFPVSMAIGKNFGQMEEI